MPYIKATDQKRLSALLAPILIANKAELCYLINSLQMRYCEQNFSATSPQKVNYQLLSDAVAAANDANFEFRCRVIVPYELHKRRENGDIFQDFIRKANI